MAAMQTPEIEEEKNAWVGLLRRMLPAGAPLPDEEHLDYSISVDYIGPPLPFKSQTKRDIPSSSRNPNSTSVKQKGKPAIEEFGSVDSDSNSMFSLKRLSISADQVDLKGEVISNFDSDSKFSLRSLFASTAQSEDAVEKNSQLGKGDSGDFIDLDLGLERERRLTQRSTVSCDVAVNAAAIPREERRKKVVCKRCRKGSGLNVREACIVWGARFFKNCMCS